MISKLEKKLKNLVFDLPNENLPQAAILILLIENQNDLSIVFTERSKSLPSHAGEVSFPGGKREAEDEDLIETALRQSTADSNWLSITFKLKFTRNCSAAAQSIF